MSKLQIELMRKVNKILSYGVPEILLIDFERIAIKRYLQIAKKKALKDNEVEK